MRAIVLLLLVVFLASCTKAPEPKRVTVLEIESLVKSGYRGPVIAVGYYYFDPEGDSLYAAPIGEYADWNLPNVTLSLEKIVQREQIKDWLERQRYITPYDRKYVEVYGDLCREPLEVGGIQVGLPSVWTFIRVDRIEKKEPN